MSARQIGSELRMLAAGLLLGRLVLRKPAAPEPVVVRITEPAPKPRRKLLGLTQNALATGIIAAVVSGVISFAVAHYQSQDSAKQAATSQQAAIASQIQVEAAKYFQDLDNAVLYLTFCSPSPKAICPQKKPDGNEIFSDEQPLDADLDNVSDRPVYNALTRLLSDGKSLNLLVRTSQRFYVTYDGKLTDDYSALTFLCGQLIQGKT